MAELYRDRWISCSETEIVVRGYYVPWGTKRIASELGVSRLQETNRCILAVPSPIEVAQLGQPTRDGAEAVEQDSDRFSTPC